MTEPQHVLTPETRSVLPSIGELSAKEIEGLMSVNLTMRDRLAGTDGKRVAEWHNDLLVALAEERERRVVALAELGDTMWDDDLDPA